MTYTLTIFNWYGINRVQDHMIVFTCIAYLLYLILIVFNATLVVDSIKLDRGGSRYLLLNTDHAYYSYLNSVRFLYTLVTYTYTTLIIILF